MPLSVTIMNVLIKLVHPLQVNASLVVFSFASDWLLG